MHIEMSYVNMDEKKRKELQAFIQSQGICYEPEPLPPDPADASEFPFGLKQCPECHNDLDFTGTYCRPAQEECGHIKCRSCMIHSMARGVPCRPCAHGMQTEPAVWGHLILNDRCIRRKQNSNQVNNHMDLHRLDSPNAPISGREIGGNRSQTITLWSPTQNRKRSVDEFETSSSEPEAVVSVPSIPTKRGASTMPSVMPLPISVNQIKYTTSHGHGICDKRTEQMQICNFLCEVCGKSYSSQWILDLHIGTHSPLAAGSSSCVENRPYPCYKCPMVCQNALDLFRHVSRHYSAGQPFKCSMCGIAFGSKTNLLRHIQSFHGFHIDSSDTESDHGSHQPLDLQCMGSQNDLQSRREEGMTASEGTSEGFITAAKPDVFQSLPEIIIKSEGANNTDPDHSSSSDIPLNLMGLPGPGSSSGSSDLEVQDQIERIKPEGYSDHVECVQRRQYNPSLKRITVLHNQHGTTQITF